MAAEKLKALRIWMKKNTLQAYIVPHADMFQSEYVADSDERLAWMTGFTGSAGSAVIGLTKAALFVDGRYVIQATKETDKKQFEIVEMTKRDNMTQWIKDHVKKNGRVGFDPNLFTASQIAQYKKVALQHGWILAPISQNPIDILWENRPDEVIRAAEIHPLEYAGVPREKKIKDVIAAMSHQAGALLMAQPSLVCWLLNIRGRDVAHNPVLQSMALIEKTGRVTVFADLRKIPKTMRAELKNTVSFEGLDALYDRLARFKKTVQADFTNLPFSIQDFCDKKRITLINQTDPAILMRALKNKAEIKGMKRAQAQDSKAFTMFLKWFAAQNVAKTTITEWDIMTKLRAARAASRDFVDESFTTIAGFGPNGAIVHYAAKKKTALRLKPGNVLLLDSGGQYRFGTTDVTRTLAVGKPTKIMRHHYTIVLKGLIALSTARFPMGTTGAQLDALARAPIWENGLIYTHGTGHGVGAFAGVHEGPQGFSPNYHVALEPGMILSVEPGIYLKNKYGIRLENLVVVVLDKKSGDMHPMLTFETITNIPFDDALIDWTLLDKKEREFMKRFGNHA